MKSPQLQRYSAGQRSNHWAVVTCFVLAGVSGFALFHPALFWLTNLLGGPQWTRILHPYIGIAMFILFLGMFLMFVGANVWRKEDSAWLGSASRLISEGNAAKMPAVGKYNGGQKLVFWVFTLCLIVLLATGLLFWQAWFAASVPIPLQRIAVLLHAIAAFVLVLGVIVHAYAAIWVKGTLGAMVRGTVSAAWAKHHHPLWYRDQVAGKK
ncbi:MAG: formate dehydrogenase subunit gamma [Comamonas sp. SCN 65-56]|uniref:formate dehydrogenase subunit gamma n=1 Tax=Comamonas sp. SCN 65-56 TaxID=1660095 RepID=UPI0008684EF5|nr:formate dehydrogenase subunit gamma [Comamonas sp. SCN 65-56]ODS90978.1 MAG: formate dehydrogenase subunit gamma [Comamonas sp. SCN 65-56]